MSSLLFLQQRMRGEHGVEGGKGAEPRQGGPEEASEVVNWRREVMTSLIEVLTSGKTYEEEVSDLFYCDHDVTCWYSELVS
jgi:hypothetical protein